MGFFSKSASRNRPPQGAPATITAEAQIASVADGDAAPQETNQQQEQDTTSLNNESTPSSAKAKRPGIGSLFMGDRVIWVVFFFLCIISLIEVYSAASTLAYKSGRFWDPLVKQALFLAGGTIIVIVVHRIPCRMFKILPVLLLPLSVILLLITLLSGAATNDAARWIDLGFIRFQPSEVAKGAVIITEALILSRSQQENGASHNAFKYIMFITAGVCVLILPENLSTAALLFGVVVLMMFIGRVSLKQIGALFGVLTLIVMLVVGIMFVAPKNGVLHRFATWQERLESHFTDDDSKEDDPATYDIDKGAQVAHANIAIASSNGIGKMPGNSVQRDFLSQAFSDFIYAVIIEEMGVTGAVVVVFLYIILLFRAGRISSRCERNFPPFLAMGLTLLLVSQAVLNMLVATGLFPVTGQPLSLISRGGTSTLINCAYIGMILSVSRYAKQVKDPQHTRFDGPMTEIKHQ